MKENYSLVLELTHPHAVIISSNGQLLLYPNAQTQAPSAECITVN